MLSNVISEMLSVECQYIGVENDTIGRYSIPGKERNLINTYNSKIVKELRKEIKAVGGLTAKSIIKHFGGISGFIEQDGKMARDWIYFSWDITTPEYINFRFNYTTVHVKIDEITAGLTDFKNRLSHQFKKDADEK